MAATEAAVGAADQEMEGDCRTAHQNVHCCRRRLSFHCCQHLVTSLVARFPMRRRPCRSSRHRQMLYLEKLHPAIQ